MLAPADGKLEIELRSTTIDQGGNIVSDNVRSRPGGDGFLAWAVSHGVAADLEADDDGDSFPNGYKFRKS